MTRNHVVTIPLNPVTNKILQEMGFRTPGENLLRLPCERVGASQAFNWQLLLFDPRGGPATPLRLRFSEAIVARLLDLQWWQFRLYDLDIRVDDIETSLSWIEDHKDNLPLFKPQVFSALELHAEINKRL